MVFLGVTRVNQVTVVVLLLVASLAQAKVSVKLVSKISAMSLL
jgi:hypothetical protein